MAIEFEQEKNGLPIMGILIGAVVIGAVFFGSYFLLFKKPEIIDVVLPGGLRAVSEISQIPFQPETIVSSEKFKALRQYGTRLAPPQAGKSNPFLP